MCKSKFLSIVVLLSIVVGCKDKHTAVSNTTAAPVDSLALIVPPPRPPFAIEKMNMKDIEKHEIMEHGCLCKLSDDTSSNFIFADDRNRVSVIKYDGTLTRYLAVEAEKVVGDHITKEYKNVLHTIKFEGDRSKDPKSDSGTILTGTLKVFDSKGILLVDKKVSGTCSC